MTENQNKRSIIKVGTFFSGIGAPEKALERLKKEKVIEDYKLEFFSEIDKNAIKSYCAIHNVSEELNLGSILDIKGKDLPYCDLWIGGFPCQDISVAGNMKGFDFNSSTRSSLGWEIIRLLKEVKTKPNYVIFENVANITSKAFKDTLDLFKKDLEELGYKLYDDILIATDYGIPQIRKRYFLVCILNDKEFDFPQKNVNNLKMKDILNLNVNEEFFLTDSTYKLDKNNNRIYTNKNNSNIEYEIDINKFLEGKRCGIDKHINFNQSQMIYSENGFCPTVTARNTPDNCKIAVTNENDLETLKIRKITPKEAWKLMGFSEEDYDKASKVCSKYNLYHQAGNSIVVDVIYNILKELLK